MMNDITERVHALFELKKEAAILDNRITAIENSIKEDMENSGIYELEGVDFKITWNMVQSRRFDQSVFKSIHPQMYESFRRLTESRRFCVTKKGDN